MMTTIPMMPEKYYLLLDHITFLPFDITASGDRNKC